MGSPNYFCRVLFARARVCASVRAVFLSLCAIQNSDACECEAASGARGVGMRILHVEYSEQRIIYCVLFMFRQFYEIL